MCKQRTAIIIIGIAIFIMVAAMLFLLYTSTISIYRTTKVTYPPKFCPSVKQKCLNDKGCRMALTYLETFCRYSDHLSLCSKHCQTMVSCLSLNKVGAEIFKCQCHFFAPISTSPRVLQPTTDLESSTGSPPKQQPFWCFPFDVQWCPAKHSQANKAICAKLDSCAPYEHLCSGNLTIAGCEYLDLKESSSECSQLFETNGCSDLCRMITRLAWNRTKMKPLLDCVCEKYLSPCDLEKNIIINSCLSEKRPNQKKI